MFKLLEKESQNAYDGRFLGTSGSQILILQPFQVESTSEDSLKILWEFFDSEI